MNDELFMVDANWTGERYEVHTEDEYHGCHWASFDGENWVYAYPDGADTEDYRHTHGGPPPTNGTPVMGRDFDNASIHLIGGPRNSEVVI